MTGRERRLRARIDQLTDQRDHARRLSGIRLWQPRRCVYCGQPTARLACPSHADLLHHDPEYSTASARTTPEGSCAGGGKEVPV